MDYLPSLTYRALGDETDKKLHEPGNFHYTQTTENIEYMKAGILSNRWVSTNNVGCKIHHCTRSLSLPALSKVQYKVSYFILFLHSTHTGPHPVQIFLEETQSFISPPRILLIVASKCRSHELAAN